MMNLAQIEYIDINKKYFEIEGIDFGRFICMFDDEKGLKVFMNHVISKTNAIRKANQIFQAKQNEFTELYISIDAMKVSQIKDYFGNRIFEFLPEDISGWVVFFDPMPFANWEHECQYLFIVNDNCIEKIDYQRGVADVVQLERIC